jgi:tRNA(Ile)-lysidine synthase
VFHPGSFVCGVGNVSVIHHQGELSMDSGGRKRIVVPAKKQLRPGILYPQLFPSLSEDETILIAVSGGADSMALLYLSLPPESERRRLIVGHVHHGTGEFADKAEVLVRETCELLGLQYACEHVRIDPARRKRVGFEAAARELRYAALEKMGLEGNAAVLLTAHSRDDLVETYLMSSMRGAGLTGLTGLKPVRGLWHRPLLKRTREELREFADSEKVPFIDDPANLENRFTRVAIRQQIMPLIREEFGESAISNIARTVEYLQEADESLDAVVLSAIDLVTSRRAPGWVSIDAAKLRGYLDELIIRVLRRILAVVKGCSHHDVYLDRNDRKRLLDMVRVQRSGQSIVVAGVTITDRDELEFTIHTSESVVQCDLPGEWTLPDGSRLSATLEDVKTEAGLSVPGSKQPGFVERFDSDKLGDRITLRPWRKGDKFHPLGSNSGDVRVTRRLRRASRERIGPLWVMLTDEEEIAWVLGERIAEPFKVTDRTSKVSIFRYDPPANLQGG